MTEGGVVVRSFMEATMHIVQLKFFGLPVTKVQPALYVTYELIFRPYI